jgi:hypothetical protein
MYEIIVHNAQGASEAHEARTKAGIERWLDTWRDPENLTARILLGGREVATKPRGRKRIDWSKS